MEATDQSRQPATKPLPGLGRCKSPILLARRPTGVETDRQCRRKVSDGGRRLVEAVTGTVAPAAAVPLLAQSFFARFKSWSIENANQALVLEPKGDNLIIQSQLAARR